MPARALGWFAAFVALTAPAGAFSQPAVSQSVAIAAVSLSFPASGSATITQSQNGVSHTYVAELAPNTDEGRVAAVNVVLHEPGGPNLLAITGEAAPRSSFQAVDCLGDPPAGGLYGREREFNIPGHDAHVILTLTACEATPAAEGTPSQVVHMTVELRLERGARPRPP